MKTHQNSIKFDGTSGTFVYGNAITDEHHSRRKLAYTRKQHRSWPNGSIQRWVALYGESPWRVIAISIVPMLAFVGIYPLVGGTSPPLDSLIQQLYFSSITFSTLGYGDFVPATDATRMLAMTEAFTGAILMAFLVFVLGRRTT